MVKTITYLV